MSDTELWNWVENGGPWVILVAQNEKQRQLSYQCI